MRRISRTNLRLTKIQRMPCWENFKRRSPSKRKEYTCRPNITFYTVERPVLVMPLQVLVVSGVITKRRNAKDWRHWTIPTTHHKIKAIYNNSLLNTKKHPRFLKFYPFLSYQCLVKYNRYTVIQMNEWMNECMHACMHACMDGRTDGWVNENWIDESMKE